MQLVVWLVQVQTVLSSPLKRAQATARVISKLQSLAGFKAPKVQTLDELTNRDMGEWEGRHALEVWAANPVHTIDSLAVVHEPTYRPHPCCL